MIGDILTDKTGKPASPLSSYQPTEAISNLTARIKRDYTIGHKNQTTPFREFNDMSLQGISERDQKLFNSYVEPKSEDPDESWMWNGVKPVTRNKIISIAAHATAALIYPNVFAQNKNDEEDKGAAQVMRELIEYNIQNSDYEETFLFGIIAACVNPCVYLQSEFSEVQMTIKEQNEKGTISTKEIIDDVLSGFKTNLIPTDEMLIANIYQYEHQRQRFTIHRRFIEYDEAERIHGDHKNFEFVKPGVKAIYSELDGQFYDTHDTELVTLVEEVTYRNRLEDTEVPFINGIYLGEDNVDGNPFKHRDTQNRPKYPEAKGGYEPIDEKRFYYYKSAVSKLAPDQQLTDRLWRIGMDASMLQSMPPLAISGNETVNSSVMFPSSVNVFKPDTKVQPINGGISAVPAFNAIQMLDKDMADSAQDRERSGQSGQVPKTAREVMILDKNAEIAMGLFKKMIKTLVQDFGYLMIDDIIQHDTIADVEEITGGKTRETYKTFILPEKSSDGKKVTKKIVMDPNMIGQQFSSLEEAQQSSFDMMLQEGGFDGKTRIFRVNPETFRELSFKLSVNPDEILQKNRELEKSLNIEGYQLMFQNPFINREMVTRDFLVETYAPGQSDKYMSQNMMPLMPHVRENIDYKDLPPDAQKEMLARVGIQTQQGQPGQAAPSQALTKGALSAIPGVGR